MWEFRIILIVSCKTLGTQKFRIQWRVKEYFHDLIFELRLGASERTHTHSSISFSFELPLFVLCRCYTFHLFDCLKRANFLYKYFQKIVWLVFHTHTLCITGYSICMWSVPSLSLSLCASVFMGRQISTLQIECSPKIWNGCTIALCTIEWIGYETIKCWVPQGCVIQRRPFVSFIHPPPYSLVNMESVRFAVLLFHLQYEFRW